MKKELNGEILEKISGGNYVYDRTAGLVYVGVKGSVRTFQVKAGVNPDDVSTALRGAYREEYTNDQNDAEYIKAIQNYVVEL